MDPLHRHVKLELFRSCRPHSWLGSWFQEYEPVMGAADDRVGGTGERNMALAGEQARGRVEPDPARPGQIDLGPGVQVGEVDFGPDGPSSAFTSALSWIR